MPARARIPPHLAIAHVLFIDVVGYTKLLVAEQRAVVEELTRFVRESLQFRQCEAEGKLIRIPTGDGMALVFFESPDQPAQCAIQIAKVLKNHPRIQLRMGMHSGPVDEVKDVNNRSNVAGAGINLAQRVMGCGDAGHILVSKRLAEDLAEDSYWQTHLHDLGEIELKHGVKLGIANLYDSEFGNPELPEKLKQARGEQVAAARRATLRHRWAITAVAFCLPVLLVAGFWTVRYRTQNRKSLAVPLTSKSVAVLPFDNLSDEKENAFFTDGVQDEILTDLAKLADLKVISRTSVMQYKTGIKRNLREIAQALGVAHVVEGTVQRSGNRVRVSAQLIDARTDQHLWAEHYDRPLNDVFTVQSEIAEKIAAQLQAKLSPTLKAEIERPPTGDIAAFDLYTRGKVLLQLISFSSTAKDNLLQGVELLNQAVARDPNFFDAYCQLVLGNDMLYFFGYDHTEPRRLLAEHAVRTVARLRPEAADTHLAQADYFYRCYLDYNRALAELEIAARALPNRPLVFMEIAAIARRQGRWHDCVRNFEKALELDPQNIFPLQQISLAYQRLRQFPEMAKALDRGLALAPNDIDTRTWRGLVELDWKADPKPLHQTIDKILSENPAAAEAVTDLWLYVGFCERDGALLARALATHPTGPTGRDAMKFPRAWWEGLAARTRGDDDAARNAFSAARIEMERLVRDQPNYGPAHSMLAMIYAGLGDKEGAVREGQRAAELLPITKDAINGAHVIEFLAVIYAWIGDNDRAIAQLSSAINVGGLVSYGELRLHPYWDPLRNDPRFEKLVEEAKQPVKSTADATP